VERIAKIVLIIVGAAFLLLCFYACWGYRRYEARRRDNAGIAAELDATYQAQLSEFQRALPLGTARSDIEKYLTLQKTQFSSGREDVVKLGDEPGDGFTCDRWGVYVYFKFGRVRRSDEVLPEDPLTEITLQKIGHCL